MKLGKNTGHILPFYRDLSKQNRFQHCCDNRFGVLTSTCNLPPFQISVPSNNCTVELINVKTGAITVLDIALFENYFDVDTGQYIIENNSAYIDAGLPTGQHYLQITCADKVCYSEVINICEFCGYEEPCLKVVSCTIGEDCCSIVSSLYSANVANISLVQTAPDTYNFLFNSIDFVSALVLAGATAINCNYNLQDSSGNNFFLNATINTVSVNNIQSSAFPLTFSVDKTFVFPCGDTTALITMSLEQVITEPVSFFTSINLVSGFECSGPMGEPIFEIEACDLLTSKKVYEAICYSIGDQGLQTILGNSTTISGDETGGLAIQRKLRTDCSNAIVIKPYFLTWDPLDPCGTYELNEV